MITTKFAEIIVLGSAIYHLVMGSACLLSRRQISKLVYILYKMQLPEKWDPLLELNLKPLGAFAVWTGLVCATAFFVPGPWNLYIKLSLAILFLMRASFRYIYRDVFAQSMKVSWERSRKNVLINVFLAAALVVGSGL